MKKNYILTLLLATCFFFKVSAQCSPPTNLTVTNITGTSAVLSWTTPGSATSWEIIVQAFGSPAPTNNSAPGIISNVNPYVVTGLTPCTAYQFYVRAVCGPNDFSTWSGPGAFGVNSNLSLTAVVTNPNTVTLSASGGTAPYQYALNGMAFQPSSVFTGLLPGTNVFQVRDASGCIVEHTVVIQGPFAIAVNGVYNDFNNDGFTNVGDVINYQITINNTGNTPITNIGVTSADVNISGGPIASLNSNASDTTTFTGMHLITQADINLGNFTGNFTANGFNGGSPVNATTSSIVNLNISNGIKMNAFIDSNGNGIKDGIEQNFSNGSFSYQINNGTVHNVTSSDGLHYLYESNPANTYNLTFAVDSSVAAYYTLTTSSYTNVTVPLGSGIVSYNFPITVNPYKDIAVSLYQYNAPPRPGFTYQNMLAYHNIGNQTITSGTVTFIKNNSVAITNVSQSGIITTANGFTYDFVNLLPNEVRYIYITMQVPAIPTVTLGQTLTNSASVTVPVGDINPNNNNADLTQVIVGSWDPNDKVENHGGKIVFSTFTSNDYLTYTIQFENTGTYQAVNARVNDLLDAKLDETSIKMLNVSHPYVLDRVGNNLNWNFNGIDLQPGEKGFINFEVKPKPSYALGDIIPNTASIYFDFNPAIVTNTSNTEFVTSLSAPQFGNQEFRMYPNPTNSIVTISLNENDKIDSITVMDLLGKTIQTKTFNNAKATLDLSALTNGMYFLKVKANGLEKVMKIMKQ